MPFDYAQLVTTANTTTLVFTFNGTASGTEVYSFVWRL